MGAFIGMSNQGYHLNTVFSRVNKVFSRANTVFSRVCTRTCGNTVLNNDTAADVWKDCVTDRDTQNILDGGVDMLTRDPNPVAQCAGKASRLQSDGVWCCGNVQDSLRERALEAEILKKSVPWYIFSIQPIYAVTFRICDALCGVAELRFGSGCP